MRPRPQLLLCALATGAALGAASLPGSLGTLAFVGLVPLLTALAEAPPALEALAAGFGAGLVYFGLAFFWLPFAQIGGGPALAAAYALGLPVLASVTATWAAAVAGLARRSPRLALAAAPGLWVALEYARSQEWLLSVPWQHLGYALAEWPSLAQGASVGGLYGLSFWIAAVNAGLVLGPHLRAPACAALCAALAAPLLPGLALPDPSSPAEDALRVAAVQPAIAHEARHQPERFHENLRALLALSERALAEPADLLVWPESAWERPLAGNGDAFLAAVAHGLGAPLVTGVWRVPAAGARDAWRNVAVLAAGDGRTRTVAEKVHPIPVYERAPGGLAAQALARLGLWTGRFERGAPRAPAAVPRAGADPVQVGVLVCIDASYPALARRLRREGARLLVAVANEAGTGVWSARLHERVTRLRAIEGRVPLVRVANTGPTRWIDAYGRILGELPAGAPAAAARAIELAGLPPLAVRLGDLPAALAALSALAAAAAALRPACVRESAADPFHRRPRAASSPKGAPS
jgi:apolipoprotein N-acyltransferase